MGTDHGKTFAELRRWVEALLRDRAEEPLKTSAALHMIHELETRQIELEMQTEKLRQAHEQIAAQLGARTADLEGANEILRQNEERLRQVAENSGVFIWEVDANGLYRYTSPTVERILGYTPDELVGKMHFYDLFAAAGREVLKAATFEVFAAKASFRAFSNPNISKDGRLIFLETSGVAILDETGNLSGYRGADIDITARRQAEEELKERIKFESLLADISARFVNLAPDQVDSQIQNAQQRICECLQVDRSAMYQVAGPDNATIQLTHPYHRPVNRCADDMKVEELLRRLPQNKDDYLKFQTESFFPWLCQRARQGHVSIFSRVEELPEEAAIDKESLRRFGTKSSAIFPLEEGGVFIGIISFAMLWEERKWPEFLVQGLRLLVEVFAHAIARKRMDQALRESETRLKLATESAQAGLWDLEIGSGEFWIDNKARELFNLAPDDSINLEKLLSLIHPEDVASIRQAIMNSVQSRDTVHVDYRVIQSDGSVRWMSSRGRSHIQYLDDTVHLLGVTVDITERKQMEAELLTRLQVIAELKARLERENLFLKEEYKLLRHQTDMVGQSKTIQKVFKQIERVAPTDSLVLIMGETGTGKELVARAIHAHSTRKNHLMVTVNCAALTPTLIESELFGREKGAYTGALTRQIGRFEIADGSTLFLDEIGELPLDIQSKLLRVLQEGEFERLGNPRSIRVNVRMIAATNRNLEDEVRKGAFRKDLYYRLKIFPITVPPLRERVDDIPLLIWSFINEFNTKMGKTVSVVSQKAMDKLKAYSWPGNVRELRNMIEKSMILSHGENLEMQITAEETIAEKTPVTLDELEHRHILDTLTKTMWRIKGPHGAAKMLGIKAPTLYARMKKLGIPCRAQKSE